MPESRVRVALIGAGSMATRYHHPSLASLPDVELAAVCDLVPGKAERTAERFSIPRVYADYRRIDPQQWAGREAEGRLLVPHAGEVLYRVAEK